MLNYIGQKKALNDISKKGKVLYIDSTNTCYYVSTCLISKSRYQLLKRSTAYRISDKLIQELKDTFGYGYAFDGIIISWLFMIRVKKRV